MDAAANKSFLERVMDVPGPNDPGHLGVFTHMKNTDPKKNGGKDFVLGWPCKTVDEIISKGHWINGTSQFFDVWYCTSKQSETGTNSKGKPKAIRLAKNAMSLKAIWVDVDVGNKPGETKHYSTITEALDAMLAFIAAVGLPAPSALVNSGGGLHLYWISSEPLATADWEPYAEGLKALLLREGVKCDAGLTTDPARILRVPGTLNHKYDPPKPVVLMSLGQDYNFASELLFLTSFKMTQAPRPAHQSVPLAYDPIEPGAVFDAPDPAFAGLDASEQLNKKAPHLVDPAPIMEQCGFYKDALATGGVNHDNPLWNIAVLGTAFMEDGNAIAHQISRGHRDYIAGGPDATQALYDRKLADRSNGGIGYPSCAAIAGAGCKSCATCPLFAEGKSPLNIRPPRVPGITATVKPQTQTAQALLIPEGYDIDGIGRICEVEVKQGKTGNLEETWYPLFYNKIDMAFVEKGPIRLSVHISLDLGHWDWVCLKAKDIVGSGSDKVIVDAGFQIVSRNKARIEGFWMAFIAKMIAAAEAQQSIPFGWHQPQGPIEGFAYGQLLHLPDGTSKPATATDPVVSKQYKPVGDAQPWYDAWDFIKRQQRVDLDMPIVAAFAAPLMALSGQNGGMLAIVGDPGAGKTYSTMLGCAVWGHPLETKSGKKTSEKNIEGKMGTVKNLPLFWDEISNETMQARAMSSLDDTTSGAVGGRNNQDGTARAQRSWSTLVVITGNLNFTDYIVTQQKNHGASLRRVFEVWVPKDVPNPVGRISNTSISDRAMQKLNHNFGVVGMDYAKLLAQNTAQIEAMMTTNLDMFSKVCGTDPEERFWLCMCGSLLTGAELANQLPKPVGFNVPALREYLIKSFFENRDKVLKSMVNPNNVAYGEDFFARYMFERTNQTIYTEAPQVVKAGRPGKVEWFRISSSATMADGLAIRWDKADNTLAWSRLDFEKWCKEDKSRVMSAILSSLEKAYHMTSERRSLGRGTPFPNAQETCYIIDLNRYPELVDNLTLHNPNMNTDLGIPAPTVTQPREAPGEGGVVTGLTALDVMKIATDTAAAKKVVI